MGTGSDISIQKRPLEVTSFGLMAYIRFSLSFAASDLVYDSSNDYTSISTSSSISRLRYFFSTW